MSVAVSVHLPDKMAFEVGQMANAAGCSVSLVVRNALEAYLEEQADLEIAVLRLNDPADAVLSLDEMRSEVAL